MDGPLSPEPTMLPDPTKDLEWSDFRGAIQDIFAQNAKLHPHRICVVETEYGNRPERRFTYQHVNEASNILGHHLVQSGVQREEVVMIYSHRGVDLVIAVMGILKAGATFSVLDPAYPADRQIIYLEVAQPRALITIAKATKEAGTLSSKVRTYIDTSLQLRTEVTALALGDDGVLRAPVPERGDIFERIASIRAKGPDVLVGPDSVPSLSFTSGSEGKPKGVRGRHFSLTYYFDWMAETFHLSSNDRFTMLSGIAHDPIQRDMFTPLFLGAQLLVPSQEDIQHERLAEWMHTHGATVTHLTPAMGQILVGGATASFDRLHHAFFVGDILIKRECHALRRLAPNVAIVNMYGTTETQRAVSYYEIPSIAAKPDYLDSMNDVIPAGRGMKNVQLLVVDRSDHDRICGVGEIGEIYVRAGGLAEGYLNQPQLTAQKFVQNWFVDARKWIEEDQLRVSALSQPEPWRKFYLGPRDRLYRSGDLGKYTSSGNVECCGRADDQVKIRGFRIELGEVDTHLSHHSLIRENVTLVRKNQDNEPMLVSYVVPNRKEWSDWLSAQGLVDDVGEESIDERIRRFQPFEQEVRTYLRNKLPVYAIPTAIVPMRTMPLNPNGKIDKPKLPTPKCEAPNMGREKFSSALEHLSETEASLARIWAKLIPGVDATRLKGGDSFFDLGGTSMHAQQLPFMVRRQWENVDLSIGSIYSDPQLESMANNLMRERTGGCKRQKTSGATTGHGLQKGPSDYATDATRMIESLPRSFPAVGPITRDKSPCIFLTGATGFLGAYILQVLLSRKDPATNVIALVRARNAKEALERVRASCKAYGVWSDSWAQRIRCLAGDLKAPGLGLSPELWSSLADDVDTVIHNGAQVHWISSYANLKPSNVLGTIEALKLCAEGRAKRFCFVSSTSVLDTPHYFSQSDLIVSQGGQGISENDNLEGSRSELETGYGQSKWVAERLVQESGQRGLVGSILRPGYITGDSRSGGKTVAAPEDKKTNIFTYSSDQYRRLFNSHDQRVHPTGKPSKHPPHSERGARRARRSGYCRMYLLASEVTSRSCSCYKSTPFGLQCILGRAGNVWIPCATRGIRALDQIARRIRQRGHLELSVRNPAGSHATLCLCG